MSLHKRVFRDIRNWDLEYLEAGPRSLFLLVAPNISGLATYNGANDENSVFSLSNQIWKFDIVILLYVLRRNYIVKWLNIDLIFMHTSHLAYWNWQNRIIQFLLDHHIANSKEVTNYWGIVRTIDLHTWISPMRIFRGIKCKIINFQEKLKM